MVRGTERQCSSIEVDGFRQVRHVYMLKEPLSKVAGKAIERCGSVRMVRGTERQCGSIEVDGFRQVRHISMLKKSLSKATSKVVE